MQVNNIKSEVEALIDLEYSNEEIRKQLSVTDDFIDRCRKNQKSIPKDKLITYGFYALVTVCTGVPFFLA